jgi:phosphopantetheine--protein transferase-like protein
LTGPEPRKTEWLFGRAVAKDAERRLLEQHHGVSLCAADIEIGKDRDGRPFATASGLAGSAVMPAISITHTDGLAVAIAGQCLEGEHLGIDAERIRPRQEAFQRIAFSDDELRLLESLADAERDEWVTRLWSAKEAVAKALGKGLVEGPRSLLVRMFDVRSGTVQVVLGDRLAREFPEHAGIPLIAKTAQEGDVVVAITLCERNGGTR